MRGKRGGRRGDTFGELVRVAETPVGRGVFARRKLSAGRVLGEILGEVLPIEPDDPSYCMELPSGRVLEPAAPLRFPRPARAHPEGCDQRNRATA